MIDTLIVFLDLFLYFSCFIIYPLSIFINNTSITDIYLSYIEVYQIYCERVIQLYFFYNILGECYLEKWGVEPLFFERVSILYCGIWVLLPVRIYVLFWMLFFHEYGGDNFICYIIPILLVLN